MILVNFPQKWSAAHRPVEFLFDLLISRTFVSVTNVGGFAKLNFSTSGGSPFPLNWIEGYKVYIEDGVYEGEHEITDVTFTGTNYALTLDTAYVSNDTQTLKYIVIPTIKVYKGYTSLEPYPTELPLELIATFKPEVNPDYQVGFDISGYLKNIFSIEPPTDGIDYNMFNQFRISFQYSVAEYSSGNPPETFVGGQGAFLVLNSAIKTDDLMSDYYNTGKYLHSDFLFDCGKTILTRITSSFARNYVLEGEEGVFDFNGDFNDDFLIE